jgi:hypothetical protein
MGINQECRVQKNDDLVFLKSYCVLTLYFILGANPSLPGQIKRTMLPNQRQVQVGHHLYLVRNPIHPCAVMLAWTFSPG